jgi:hypothetical protein
MPYYPEQAHFPTVLAALQNNNVDLLKSLITLLPVNKKPTRKGDLIDLISKHLDGELLKVQWKQLDQTQQAAIAEVVHSSEVAFNEHVFEAKYGQQPNWGSRDRYGYNYTPSRLALFFYRYSYGQGSIMPDDLKERLKVFVPKPSPITLKTLEDAPSTCTLKWREFDYENRRSIQRFTEVPVRHFEMEQPAQIDLQTLLRLVNTGKVAVSDKTFLPTTATMKAIAAMLQGGDYYLDNDAEDDKNGDEQPIGFIKAFAWPMILQAAGLAQLVGKKLQLSHAGQKALTAPPAETLRSVWNKWLKSKLLDEFRRIDVIKGQTGKGKRGLTAVDGRRAVISQALAQCPVGHWIFVDEFARYMIVTGFDFEVSRDPTSLYISEPGYGYLGYDSSSLWNIFQKRYLLCLLFEYAATLGILDVAYVSPGGIRNDYSDFWGADDLEFFSRYDGLLSFRLTPLGAYCLGVTKQYTPAPVDKRPILRVLPNLELVATGTALTPGDKILLDLYAQKKSDAVWQLEQAKLLTSVESGHSIEALEQFLQAASHDPLPETVKQFLVDVAARAQSVQDRGTARLLECADPMLAVLIANDSRTKKLCFLAGERHLVVPTESDTRFRNALRQLGYTIALNPK